jgi:hypothetical protein
VVSVALFSELKSNRVQPERSRGNLRKLMRDDGGSLDSPDLAKGIKVPRRADGLVVRVGVDGPSR